MFSSISSYIFGASEEGQAPPAPAPAEAAPQAPSGGLFWTTSSTAPPRPKSRVDEAPVMVSTPAAPTPQVGGAPASPKHKVPSTCRGAGRGKKGKRPAPLAPATPPSEPSEEECEWVLVGPEAKNTPLTLGSLNEVLPTPPTGSTGSSATPSESGDEGATPMEDSPSEPSESPAPRAVVLSRTTRRLASPFSCANAVSVAQMRAHRAAQASGQKRAGKALSAKAVGKKNKAVKNDGVSLKKKAFTNKHQLSFKSAGANKQLKQC